jgi:release factor glutamine methyltransferase
VNSFVLIPRPETEELVDWIIRSNSLISPHILDIGTGSGCIPIAIKHHVPDAKIYGVDISSKAIEVAVLNSSINKLEAEFYERDILNWQKYKWGTYDIIVSNPPYVRELEKSVMDKNVLAYEPENALFVPNDDPLLFFRKITEFALKHLAYNGKLFFEINEYLGEEIHNLLLSSGFKNIKIKKDINGKNRMIYCQLLKMD